MPNVTRCGWARTELEHPLSRHGVGRAAARRPRLFEFLILEGAQAGLSWETILRKREAYRKAFDDFDPARVARYTAKKVERLMADAGIVRNRLKIDSSVTQRPRISRRAEGVRLVRRVHLAVRRRQAAREHGGARRRCAREHGAVRRDEQGPEEARLPLRRHDDLLRLHAGDRAWSTIMRSHAFGTGK